MTSIGMPEGEILYTEDLCGCLWTMLTSIPPQMKLERKCDKCKQKDKEIAMTTQEEAKELYMVDKENTELNDHEAKIQKLENQNHVLTQELRETREMLGKALMELSGHQDTFNF